MKAIIVAGLTSPLAIAIDVEGGKIYWTDPGTSKIQRDDIDTITPSNPEDLITTVTSPISITLDSENNMIYWTENSTNKMQRAKLDGSCIEPLGIAIDVSD